MHIHLPKPLHGWREVFGEIGVIVVGILIALAAEQTVEALHHRSQVREATEKLHIERVENRSGMAFDLAKLEESIRAADRQLALLGNCSRPIDPDRIPPVQQFSFLAATDSAWVGVRDSALLPLMPNSLVQNYWKIDKAGVAMDPTVDQLNQTRTNAQAAVDALRRGLADRQACREAVGQLLRLRSVERTLWRQVAYYHFTNELMLRGRHLTIITAAIADRQVSDAEHSRLPAQ